MGGGGVISKVLCIFLISYLFIVVVVTAPVPDTPPFLNAVSVYFMLAGLAHAPVWKKSCENNNAGLHKETVMRHNNKQLKVKQQLKATAKAYSSATATANSSS